MAELNKPLNSVGLVTDFTDEDQLYGNFGNVTGRMTIANVKKGLNKNNDMLLQQIAFYIDVNEPAGTPLAVNTGGNASMLKLWKEQWRSGVMDQEGNWAELSKIDNRYFADGTPAVDIATGEAVPELANCNFIGIVPKTYCYIQTVDIAGHSVHRLWLSLVPLPGGWMEPEQKVGMFKGWIDGSGRLRSLPGKVPSGTKTIKQFWDAAQLYGKSYGLAPIEFRNALLFYMMGIYKQRGSQECKLEDNTLVWGVGLDGSESSNGFDSQKNIKTGATLSLGTRDGKVEVLDAEGATCHSIRVGPFENPWGQYWEMIGNLCSIGNTVLTWKSNFMPTTSAPAVTDFTAIKTVQLVRHNAAISNSTSTGHEMNIIPLNEQGIYMIPMGVKAGISYNDYYYYNETGQLWLAGGDSYHGAACGLACALSSYAWTYSYSYIGVRLACFGDINEVQGKDLVA